MKSRNCVTKDSSYRDVFGSGSDHFMRNFQIGKVMRLKLRKENFREMFVKSAITESIAVRRRSMAQTMIMTFKMTKHRGKRVGENKTSAIFISIKLNDFSRVTGKFQCSRLFFCVERTKVFCVLECCWVNCVWASSVISHFNSSPSSSIMLKSFCRISSKIYTEFDVKSNVVTFFVFPLFFRKKFWNYHKN